MAKFLESVLFSILAGGLLGVTVALVVLALLNAVAGVSLDESGEYMAYAGTSVLAALYVMTKVSGPK